MKRWFTSDQHYGHANIIRYCGRPILRKGDIDEHGKWASTEAAKNAATRCDNFLIKQANMRIKADDSVISVGDFMCYGAEKGVQGLRNHPDYYLKQLNGHYVIIEGNHDIQNNVKPIGRHLFTNIAKLRVFVSHYPTDNGIQDPELMAWVRKNCAFAICGHVHEKWAEMWDNGFLNINVGVDVHKYLPISDSEIYNIYERAKRNRVNGKV
ncbi:MAG: metallophosphoesterase family protein [Eubacteriales bacterium]|nr:metallophosphoesterase family protein [Eubacteriales bacterium]